MVEQQANWDTHYPLHCSDEHLLLEAGEQSGAVGDSSRIQTNHAPTPKHRSTNGSSCQHKHLPSCKTKIPDY